MLAQWHDLHMVYSIANYHHTTLGTFKSILWHPDSQTGEVTLLCLEICTSKHIYWPEFISLREI